MNYARGHLPYFTDNWISILAIVMIGLFIGFLIYVIINNKIRLHLSINIGLSLLVVGLYPVLDGLMVDFTGDKDSVAFRWIFIILGLMLIGWPIVYGYLKMKKDGCIAKLNTDWSNGDELDIMPAAANNERKTK